MSDFTPATSVILDILKRVGVSAFTSLDDNAVAPTMSSSQRVGSWPPSAMQQRDSTAQLSTSTTGGNAWLASDRPNQIPSVEGSWPVSEATGPRRGGQNRNPWDEITNSGSRLMDMGDDPQHQTMQPMAPSPIYRPQMQARSLLDSLYPQQRNLSNLLF